MRHIFLPQLELDEISLLAEHEAWLSAWLQEAEGRIERADVAASMCLQGALSEMALYHRTKTDWVGIMNEYLLRDGKPIAYSEEYGKRLYKFAFWIQTEVHAIHARWWIEMACNQTQSLDFKSLIEELVQPSGWIYNPQVSCTGLRTRMKSEYLMSLAMGLEVLEAFGAVEDHRTLFEATLASEPLTGYLGAEYFRLYSLHILNEDHLAPAGLDNVLKQCEVGEGYCDFDVKAKVDDYMGTAKRVGRDIPVHSGLSSLHAAALTSVCGAEVRTEVEQRVRRFGAYLGKNPLDIQPFSMRDLDVPFGTGLSPLEVIAASGICSWSK